MAARGEELEKRFYELVERFRRKGAVGPEKAMTTEELNLPAGFRDAMRRRLGRLGVFVEVDGKYYLSEERLRQIEELRTTRRGPWKPRTRVLTLKIVKMTTLILFATLLLVNLFVRSWELRVVSSVFLIVWLAISILQIYLLARARKRILTSNHIGDRQSTEGER